MSSAAGSSTSSILHVYFILCLHYSNIPILRPTSSLQALRWDIHYVGVGAQATCWVMFVEWGTCGWLAGVVRDQWWGVGQGMMAVRIVFEVL